jgi:hypothetical protein
MMDLPSPWDQAYASALSILDAVHFARDQADRITNGTPPRDPELDYDCPPLPGLPTVLLAHLAQLWVISDLKDAKALLIEQSLPHLGRARGTTTAIQIGGAYGTSVAEAALRSARRVTMHLQGACGCGALVQIVQVTFPRDRPADPWELGMTILFAGQAESIGGDGGKWLIEKDGKRSEFKRRLYTYKLTEAARLVRVGPLCKWLLNEFGAFDWQPLREGLKLEFLQAFPPQQPKPKWCRKNKQLWYKDILCRSFGKKAAPNQEIILDAFEEEEWPQRIDDPLDPGKLPETIKSLQNALRSKPITFERDGRKGIRWRERSADNP